MPRSRTIDRTLATESRTIWIVSIAILLLGALMVLWVVSPGERQRRAVMDRIVIGDEAERVRSILGEPRECPTATLERLRPMFPSGWPSAATLPAVERLRTETAFVWIYPLDDDDQGSCRGADDQTEIGFTADRRVHWYVAVTGKTALVLPGDYAPGDFAQ